MKKSLKNYCLLASPSIDDPFFAESVVYITKHNNNGAYGFVINKPADVDIKQLFEDLNLANDHILPHAVLAAGPMRPDAGFVLHTGQPHYWQSSLAVTENICLTTSKDILNALAHNQLKHFQFMLGYCSWSKNQLEQELENGDWFTCEADAEILFNLDYAERYNYGYSKANIHREWFVTEVGNA